MQLNRDDDRSVNISDVCVSVQKRAFFFPWMVLFRRSYDDSKTEMVSFVSDTGHKKTL